MGTLAVDNIQHTDGSSAVTLNNATITTGTVPAAGVTGTLSSGVTFPAGHVIQTVFDDDTGTDRKHNSNSAFADAGGLAPAITIKQANSKILITANSSGSYGGSYELIVNLKRVITGGATTNEIVSAGGWNSWIHSRNTWGSVGGQYLDAPAQAVDTVITYSIRIRRATAGSDYIYWNNSGGYCTMTLQEIAV